MRMLPLPPLAAGTCALALALGPLAHGAASDAPRLTHPGKTEVRRHPRHLTLTTGFRVVCPPAHGRCAIAAVGRRRGVVIFSRHYSIAPGHTADIRVQLTRAGTHLLRLLGPYEASARIRAANAGGARAVRGAVHVGRPDAAPLMRT